MALKLSLKTNGSASLKMGYWFEKLIVIGGFFFVSAALLSIAFSAAGRERTNYGRTLPIVHAGTAS